MRVNEVGDSLTQLLREMLEGDGKGEMPERLKGAGCKPVGVCLRRFESYSLHFLQKSLNTEQTKYKKQSTGLFFVRNKFHNQKLICLENTRTSYG